MGLGRWRLQAWKDAIVASGTAGGWADGPGGRYGQVCDPWRQPETSVWPRPDTTEGCVAVWISESQDDFTVGNLPRDQQNNFQVRSRSRGLADEVAGCAGAKMHLVVSTAAHAVMRMCSGIVWSAETHGRCRAGPA